MLEELQALFVEAEEEVAVVSCVGEHCGEVLLLNWDRALFLVVFEHNCKVFGFAFLVVKSDRDFLGAQSVAVFALEELVCMRIPLTCLIFKTNFPFSCTTEG